MPGLGDALSKARETSEHGLDELLRRAAESEKTAEVPAVEPIPGAEPREAEVSKPPAEPGGSVTPAEKTQLFGAPELPAAPAASALQAPGQFPSAAPPPIADAAAEAAAPPTPDAPASSPPAAEDEPPPIAPFAPSGVIRHSLRRGGAAAPAAVTHVAPSAAPMARQISALKGSAEYCIPQLGHGVEGVVQLVTGAGESPACLVFAGATSGSGSTAVAVAAALEAAGRAGRRVLLVDADLRSPFLGRLLGPELRPPDFAAVLAGRASLREAAVHARAEGITVLPLLGGRQRGSEEMEEFSRLCSGEAIAGFLAAAREAFDVTFIDAGNAAASDLPLRLAAAAGPAVLSVPQGRAGPRELRALRERFERAGALIAGAVLTFASRQ